MIYNRYIFRQAMGMLMLILISLTIVVWMATALKQLKLVTSQGQGFLLFIKMTLLTLPGLMSFIAPMALLIATLHILNKVSGDSELIVMNAGGANVWHVARPFLIAASILTIMLYVINLYLQPLSMRLLRDYVTQVRTDLISKVLQEGKFSSPEQGLTFHIRERDPNDNLLGLLIHDTRDPLQTMSYLAERGKIIKQNDRAYLIMQKGHIQRKAPKPGSTSEAVQIIAFDQYIFDLSQFGEAKEEKVIYSPRERFIGELLNPDPSEADFYQKNEGKFRSEIHERFSTPLYPLVFVMIALAMIGNARTTRQRSLSGIFIAFGLATAAKVAGVAVTNMVTKNASAVVLVYAVPVGSFIVAGVMAHLRMSQKKK